MEKLTQQFNLLDTENITKLEGLKKKSLLYIAWGKKHHPHLHIMHTHYVSTVVHVLLQVFVLQEEVAPLDGTYMYKKSING